MPPTLKDVAQFASKAYGAGPNPDFSFVQRALAQQPYAAVVRELRSSFDVEDDTDPNDDVSFNYLVTCDRQTWRLALSMVGPFAILIRTRSSEPYAQLVNPERGGAGPCEAALLRLLRGHSITVLDGDDIRQTVRHRDPDVEEPGPTIYELLFTDSEALPAG